jgi:hypothetical protein
MVQAVACLSHKHKVLSSNPTTVKKKKKKQKKIKVGGPPGSLQAPSECVFPFFLCHAKFCQHCLTMWTLEGDQTYTLVFIYILLHQSILPINKPVSRPTFSS